MLYFTRKKKIWDPSIKATWKILTTLQQTTSHSHMSFCIVGCFEYFMCYSFTYKPLYAN